MIQTFINKIKQFFNTQKGAPQNFFELSAHRLNGTSECFDIYQGKTIIVVNTASKCGLTPQYKQLEALYKKYQSQNLVVLGFPCNQFGQQETGTATEIKNFCQANYGVTFPMFEKINVNGPNTHPVYQFLKSNTRNGLFGKNIKWNFTKFVIDKNGRPIKRFAPTTDIDTVEKYIQTIL